MSNNDPKNVKLGVCKVFFDGVDLGFTKGGVEVTVETESHEVTVDQYGNTPINEYIMGRTIAVAVPLAETTLDNLVLVMPGAKLVTDATTSKKSVVVPTGVGANLLDYAKELILVPRGVDGQPNYSDAVRVPKAATPGAMTYAYRLDEERVFNCNFKGYASIEDGEEILYQMGEISPPTPKP